MSSSDSSSSPIKPVSQKEEDFKTKLLWHSYLINLMEDASIHQYALQCVPSEDLTIKAAQYLSTLEEEESCLEYGLVLELLQWFKNTFFSWVDNPKCRNCNNSAEFKGLVQPTPVESTWLAKSTENYFCNACRVYTRFPRYNHPRTLLDSRKGRCGEWAIAFTTICRALNLDARLVLDWTDHLWTEIFIPSQKRWVHVDSCEAVCDQPLLYELGWKKDLTFIIAFSKDEVQDVTWRYCSNFAKVLERRALQCRESFVLSWINQCTKTSRLNLNDKRLDLLLERQVCELAEFLVPPKPDSDNYGGRTSGSTAWRLARGEISAKNLSQPHYVFQLSESEKQNRHFHLKYNCALDEYIRVSDNGSKIKTWSSCAFFVKSVFRKVENDWKFAYLARSGGCSMGKIMWNFKFENTGLRMHKIKFHLVGEEFSHGKVKWSLGVYSRSGKEFNKQWNDIPAVRTSFEDLVDFEDGVGLMITAELSEGNGEQAWQHAQLFRQTLDSKEFPFEVEINFDRS